MVVLILMISLTLLAVHLRLAPRRFLVHAARAKDFPENRRPSRRIASPFAYRDTFGGGFSRKGKFYGEALGSSMEDYGIENGDEFFGDYVPTGASVSELKSILYPEDIVVVDDVAAASQTGKRLRKIKSIDADGTVNFYADSDDEPHTCRHIGKVIAKVTHVVN